MSRTILMHLEIEVPKEDGRSTPQLVEVIEAALGTNPKTKGLKCETIVAQIVGDGEPITVYTIHPFDDEWTWDPKTSGSHPWATRSLQEAIDHANLVRLEYASDDNVDQEWISGFWSAIYADSSDDPDSSSTSPMIGWVGPDGEFHEGEDPPVDEQGNWVHRAVDQ